MIIMAPSYTAGSQWHVLLLPHKSPLSLTATGELGGHGQWNPGQRLVRSAQNWAFCSLFTSPGSPLTQPARPAAPMFYCGSDSPALLLSPCLHGYCWTLAVLHPFTGVEDHAQCCFTGRCGVSDYILKCGCVLMCIRVCVCVSTFISRRTIRWQDELWSMSCRQNTSDLVES